MKFPHRLFVSSLIVALVLPAVTFAAKADRKKPKPGADAVPAFATVDKDSNEAISETEFVAGHEKLGAVAAKSRFEVLDKNHDSKLSKEEYAAAATPERKRRKEKVGAEEIAAFAAVDKDSNKSISETEFVTANEKLGSVAAKARFELLDKDRDGKLSTEEYAAGATPEKKRKKKNQE
jgi:Ca2+-binding EF-hand superfamily protein